MRGGCGQGLTTRTDQADLPANVNGFKLQSLLDADSKGDTWRIIEAFSRSGAPFELELAWSAGSGSGAVAKITVARSTRICLFARSLRIRAGNLASVVNRVGVTVADGYGQTHNQWEHRGSSPDQGVPQEIPVPPFARTLRLEVGHLPLALGALGVPQSFSGQLISMFRSPTDVSRAQERARSLDLQAQA